MVDNEATYYSKFPITQITHKWETKQFIPLSIEKAFLIIMELNMLFVVVMAILGYQEIFGIKLYNHIWIPYFEFPSWSLVVYCYFAEITNKTIVEISSKTLFLRITPLPWPGRTRIPISDIKHIRIFAKAHKRWLRLSYNEYRIHAQLQNGDEIPILYKIIDKEKADNFLSRIEQAIGKPIIFDGSYQ